MNPVYSQDECIATVRDYHSFLSTLFMDSHFIIEPPEGSWPNITPETMQGLNKTKEVISLLRHLPYIVSKPYSQHPEGVPGCKWTDWASDADAFVEGKKYAESSLLMSEGYEYQFGGRVPSHCIGLMYGRRDKDKILLDTGSGVVYWMACPAEVVEASDPKPSFLVYPSEHKEEAIRTPKQDQVTPNLKAEKDDSESEGECNASDNGETPPTSDDGDGDQSGEDGEELDSDEDSDENNDDDSSDNEVMMQWGPCWPICRFFEMLKNHYRQLNFIPKSTSDVIDVWTTNTCTGDPIPKGIPALLQSIYHKHGWPDLTRYDKQACLAEVLRELDEKYPEHAEYYWF
jgi:hypothetical protein